MEPKAALLAGSLPISRAGMTLFIMRQSASAALGRLARRGGMPYEKGWWSEGSQSRPQGFLFGETEGARVRGAWEVPMKGILGVSFAILIGSTMFQTTVSLDDLSQPDHPVAKEPHCAKGR